MVAAHGVKAGRAQGLSDEAPRICDPELAQTYPQLMLQILAAGWSASDQLRLRQAFELALLFADGIYRAPGVPLINHLVRTSSILVLEQQSADAAIVGLLHAVPQLHRFTGSTRAAGFEEKRQRVGETCGERVAGLVIAYGELPWHGSDSFERHLASVKTVGDEGRLLLAVRLANELEDSLDSALCFSSPGRQHLHMDVNLAYCQRLSKELGLSYIHRRLLAFDPDRQATLPPAALRRSQAQGYELPRSRLWQRSRAASLVLRMLDLGRKLRGV
jgi:hypothetical protein